MLEDTWLASRRHESGLPSVLIFHPHFPTSGPSAQSRPRRRLSRRVQTPSPPSAPIPFPNSRPLHRPHQRPSRWPPTSRKPQLASPAVLRVKAASQPSAWPPPPLLDILGKVRVECEGEVRFSTRVDVARSTRVQDAFRTPPSRGSRCRARPRSTNAVKAYSNSFGVSGGQQRVLIGLEGACAWKGPVLATARPVPSRTLPDMSGLFWERARPLGQGRAVSGAAAPRLPAPSLAPPHLTPTLQNPSPGPLPPIPCFPGPVGSAAAPHARRCPRRPRPPHPRRPHQQQPWPLFWKRA